MAQERAQDRAARLTRIVKVQEQLHRAEEQRLVEIQDRFDQLRQDETDLIALLNAENGLAGLFMDATVNRLRSLAEQQIQTALQREAQMQAVLETGSRLKAAEKLLTEAERDARREAEQQQLAEATERLGWQAPGKILGR